MAIPDDALDTIFRRARTYRRWRNVPLSPTILMALYDLMRWGPTRANSFQIGIVFVACPAAKERLIKSKFTGALG